MPFPDSPRVVFDKNPITEVICQLRFPPILEIQAAIPAAFQKEIRTIYPLFEQQQFLGVPKELAEVLSKMPGAEQMAMADSVIFKFLTESRAKYVALSRDFVAFTESKYTEWKDFKAQMAAAQAALEKVYKPSFYSRLGLRYVNAVNLENLGLAGAKWKDLLNPSFVGILGSVDVAAQVTAIATQADIDLSQHIPGAKVTVRFGIRDGNQARNTFVIDSDFFLEGHVEVTNVIQILDEFNRLDGRLFRWAIGGKGHLWDALRPRAIPA